MSTFMQYDLATNFDEELIDFIVKYDTHKQIKSVFGKMRNDMAGGGRASFLLPEVSMTQLKNYVEKCNNAGIEFNYLLNPITLNDLLINPVKNIEFTNFIDELYNIGIRAFTVNSPLLCKNIKSKYNDVRITVGLYAYPTSIQMIQYWVNMGADEITIDAAFNRDIPLLRKTLEVFKDTNIKIRLIANNFCLHGCAAKINHACNVASESAAGGSMKGRVFDYDLLNCVYNKITKPAVMMCSDWIRPEDIKYYTQLMEETGNYNLTIKLVERTRTTEFLERVAKAYIDESFDGNFLDLCNFSKASELTLNKGKKPATPPTNPPANAPAVPPYKMDMYMKYASVMQYPKITIDNKKLDGFVDYFFKGSDCVHKICGANLVEEDCKNPAVCNYCNNWAKKAVSSDPEEIAKWKQLASEILMSMETREIFNPEFKVVKPQEEKII